MLEVGVITMDQILVTGVLLAVRYKHNIVNALVEPICIVISFSQLLDCQHVVAKLSRSN